MSDTALLQASNVSFSYQKDLPVLKNVDFSLQKGDFKGLIGPNGCGKSTLLHLLTGWLKPDGGIISFQGRDIKSWNRRQLARHLAVVPQIEEGFFGFSCREIVLMGRYAHQNPLVGYEDAEDLAIAENVLSLVDLGSKSHRLLSELSGGERQRVLLARALAQCPEVILLDEPTASLDLGYQRETFRLLERLNKDYQLTILVISHDINLAALYCPALAILNEGSIIAEGPPCSVLNQDSLEEIYKTSLRVQPDEDGTPFISLRK